jgi:hypothetical protein
VLVSISTLLLQFFVARRHAIWMVGQDRTGPGSMTKWSDWRVAMRRFLVFGTFVGNLDFMFSGTKGYE